MHQLKERLSAWIKKQDPTVTKSGVWLSTAQKPVKRQSWWKGKFALFWMPAASKDGGLLSKGLLLPPPQQSGGKSFYRPREGVTYRNSTVSSDVILKLVILIVLSTFNLQFQGWFVPIYLRPILGIVAAYMMATVWSSCS